MSVMCAMWPWLFSVHEAPPRSSQLDHLIADNNNNEYSQGITISGNHNSESRGNECIRILCSEQDLVLRIVDIVFR